MKDSNFAHYLCFYHIHNILINISIVFEKILGRFVQRWHSLLKHLQRLMNAFESSTRPEYETFCNVTKYRGLWRYKWSRYLAI